MRLPIARKKDLLVVRLADEVRVYDEELFKASCLNEVASTVWDHCDGRTEVDELIALLQKRLNAPIDEEVVWLCLKQLEESNLLQNSASFPGKETRLSRRKLMRRLGLTAASLPLITSIVAPTEAQAQSCLPIDAPCTASSQCCSACCQLSGGGALLCKPGGGGCV